MPTGERYPSATSVLGAMSDKSALLDWANRIGHAEAEHIKRMAGNRGSDVHLMCEKLVLNEPIDYKKAMPFNLMMFRQLKKEIEAHVNDIRLSEGMLFSHKLKVAGSVDLVANWKGRPAIIDFKTSIREKKKEWIVSYFCQVTMYALMLYEVTGIAIDTGVILICVEQSNQAQVFEFKIMDWVSNVISLCQEYHKIYS